MNNSPFLRPVSEKIAIFARFFVLFNQPVLNHRSGNGDSLSNKTTHKRT